jgi:DNA gyrase/topoisomerase IV subunit A
MKLKKDDTIVSAYQAEGDEILIVHETGGVKRVPLIEYSLQGRGGQGIQSADPSKPSRQPVGLVTLACPNRGAKHATLLTQGGALISLEFSELPSGSRAAASRPYLSLAAGDAAHTIIID